MPAFAPDFLTAGDLLGGLHGEEAAVAGKRDELIAGRDHLERVRGGAVVDARDHAVPLARLDDPLLRLDDGRIGLVEPGLAAERQAQVRRADVDRVHSGHAQDLVEVLEGESPSRSSA